IDEEMKELQTAIAFNNKESVTEELGDLLFTLINFSRWNKIDPEEAMTKATEKFIHRFKRVESQIKSENKKFEDFNIEQLEEFWQKAKI
ncbi:MAG: MazG nucleotide pyrophosphohydrolase domain-containing protein, partial [Candidatus Sericytochromatia bacterium]